MKVYSLILISVIFLSAKSYGQTNNFWELYNESARARQEGKFFKSKNILLSLLNNPEITPTSYMPYLNNGIGVAYWRLGNIDSAINYYVLAESQIITGKDVDYDLLNSIYNNLAIVYKQKSQYQKALNYYYKSESALNKTQNRDSAYFDKLSVLYLNRGILHFENSDYLAAKNNLQTAEALKSKYKFSFIGSVYFNLARVNAALQEIQLSKAYFQKSIDQWMLEYDSSFYQLGTVYFHYGRILIENGEKERGLDYYNNALSNFLLNYGYKHPYTSDCYEYLAKYYLENQDYLTALQYSQKALISSCPDYSDKNILSNPEGYNSFLDINLIQVYQIKVKALIGLAHFNDSIWIDNLKLGPKDILVFAMDIVQNEIELIRKVHLLYFDQENRLSLNEEFKSVFVTGIEISSMLYDISGDPLYKNLSFNYAALGKSIEFQYELLERQKVLGDSPDSDIPELRIKALNLNNYIKYEEQKLVPDNELIHVWRDSLFIIDRLYDEQISKTLAERNLSGLFNIDLNALSIKQIQKKLHRNQTLVDFTISNGSEAGLKKLYTYIINSRSSYSMELTLSSADLSAIYFVHNHLNSFNYYRYRKSEIDSLYSCLNKLYRSIISPIESFIEGNKLIIVPDEELFYIPFDALIKENLPNYLNDEFLVHDYAISYLINARFLDNKKTRKILPPKVLAIKGYDADTIKNDLELSGAAFEINNILRMYRGKVIKEYYSKEDLRHKLTNRELFHFAMHSYAQDTSFRNSYILLNDNKDSIVSNRLFDYDISKLRLKTPMVVLSACETGTGRLYSGEGVMSVSRSFLIAGAESVISTYWSVNDVSSAQIMINYYQNLKRGWTKSRSLQNAKIKYLDNQHPTLQHPYFWSGYQITGNSQNIIISRMLLLTIGACLCVIVICLFFYAKAHSSD